MKRAGWVRVDKRPWRKTTARWQHQDGWRVAHCGHPTALYPWDLHDPAGKQIRSGASYGKGPDFGTAWVSLREVVEYVRRQQVTPPVDERKLAALNAVALGVPRIEVAREFKVAPSTITTWCKAALLPPAYRTAPRGGNDLARLFRAQRLVLGLSQRQVADRANVAVSVVRRIESGRHWVQEDKLIEIAGVLQISRAVLESQGGPR